MSLDHFPVGQEMQVTHAPFSVHLTLDFTKQLTFVIRERPYASTETVDIEVSPLGHGAFAVSSLPIAFSLSTPILGGSAFPASF